MTSPLLDLPGAVAGDGIDAGVAAHYGSFNGEQRRSSRGDGFVDLSHRDVVRIEGPDRLTWLHSLTTQHLSSLAPRVWTEALVLSPQGHVEHAFYGVDDGEAFVAHTEPGQAGGAGRLPGPDAVHDARRGRRGDRRARGHVAPRAGADGAVRDLRPRAARPLERRTPRRPARPAGLWAFEALRIARGEPRLGLDTDHRTIPNEVGWIGPAVHLDKGCYRGQETVARVHTLGRPPRRLTLLHLDGSENRLPTVGARRPLPATRSVGFVGTSARHHELGPIALALIKRNVPVDAQLDVDEMPAAQEVVVDPEVGLHVRPKLVISRLEHRGGRSPRPRLVDGVAPLDEVTWRVRVGVREARAPA